MFGTANQNIILILHPAGIPTLVILNEHGEIINEKARGALEDDKEGAVSVAVYIHCQFVERTTRVLL